MRFTIIFLIICISGCSTKVDQQENSKPNILFIAIDDLRPELGCYGSEIALSPNLDKLSSQGLLFNNAYCQQAICGPSRASVLTGIRPESSGVFHNYIKFRDVNPQVVTLPQHFKNNGYQTVYTGKVFHHGDLDEEYSWSRKPAIDSMTSKQISNPVGFALEINKKERIATRQEMVDRYGEVAKYGLASGAAYEAAEVPDQTYVDGYNTELAIATMKEMAAKSDQPFFLGLGFNKPHLNWVAPKKYWDLYDRSQINLSQQTSGPKDGAEMGLHPSFELRVRSGIPKQGDIDPELAITLKHAYLACVSYVDAQIGKVIKALETQGIRDNTIIIVWSDHGYHLGEMGIWGKATNYEIATRVPLMIWTPNMTTKSRGATTEALVELVDIYPSLADLAGIPIPEHVEGTSFMPLLNDPDITWKQAVFSQFPTPALREWGAYPLRPAMRETYFGPLIEEAEERIIDQQGDQWDKEVFENTLMGYAMRTKQFRFVIWKDISKPASKPIYYELYDHLSDPSETINIAYQEPELLPQLMEQFSQGWKGAVPLKYKTTE